MARLAGSRAALDALIDRHSSRLHAYLRRLLQSDADAQDLAQETFVRIYEHRARYDAKHEFVTWLYTIATNLVRDRFRWRTRHPEAPLLDDGLEGDRPAPAFRVSDPRANPGDAAVAEECSSAVRGAVTGLPDDLRVPLVLAEFEGRSHRNRRHRGCSAKTVEMRIHRARQRLQASLPLAYRLRRLPNLGGNKKFEDSRKPA
jgi:RNA polymerase sigma-70 factor (ECF subfamily)